MDYLYYIGPLLFLYLLYILVIKNSKNNLSAEDFKQKMNTGQIIDVRSKREYKSGHIINSLNIPVSNFSNNLKRIHKDKTIFMYCLSNGRATRAANILKKNGYDNVFLLKGGLTRWKYGLSKY